MAKTDRAAQAAQLRPRRVLDLSTHAAASVRLAAGFKFAVDLLRFRLRARLRQVDGRSARGRAVGAD